MTEPRRIARHVERTTHDIPAPSDRVILAYDDRYLRRKTLETERGARLLVDLAEAMSLQHGDRLVCDDGSHVEVAAAPEDLLAITGDLARLAWHIGNRHTPCQVEEARLLIRRDHVMEDMLAKLGATVAHVVEPFRPEGGAYGHGRTHGHSHSHDPHADPDAHLRGEHGHDHAHGHAHDHAHPPHGTG